jgi:hydroxymethylglutaryl-CoA lyase
VDVDAVGSGEALMKLPKRVRIIEVGPRDGLQAMDRCVDTKQKIALVDALSKTGLDTIEVTSFVSPRAVPQLADGAEVMKGILRQRGVRYRALVPNLVGARRAQSSGVDEIDFVLSASETHNRANVRKSVEESLREFTLAAEVMLRSGIKGMTVSIATAFGCPFEGTIAREKVIAMATQLKDSGATLIILSDTTGMANPVGVEGLLDALGTHLAIDDVGVHFHNTRGTGLANVLSALQCGITIFEGSVGGIGGCPFAPGATGNVPTEDMVNMLEDMGITTGVELPKLLACAMLTEEIVGEKLPGQVMKAGRTGDLHPAPVISINEGSGKG